ncbi:MAG: L,D-transpeptidase family protein [Peptococcaceae bacterium]|nr:L,D-transpeptidase family protein [Peptococcaceae bacterium]
MKGKTARAFGSRIVINLAARKLYYYEGNRLVHTYPVGVGKPSTPTPTGLYSVVEKVMNPGGVLGSRWLGLSIPGGKYGIHGTNNPSSIGGYVSNGCIRMHNRDVEELFPRVEPGTPVEIIAGDPDPRKGSAPAAAPAGSRTHTVQPGESLWEIARKYGKDLNALIQANNLADPDLIYPGQTIIIPAG